MRDPVTTTSSMGAAVDALSGSANSAEHAAMAAASEPEAPLAQRREGEATTVAWTEVMMGCVAAVSAALRSVGSIDRVVMVIPDASD
jgi:hypothetical protein